MWQNELEGVYCWLGSHYSRSDNINFFSVCLQMPTKEQRKELLYLLHSSLLCVSVFRVNFSLSSLQFPEVKIMSANCLLYLQPLILLTIECSLARTVLWLCRATPVIASRAVQLAVPAPPTLCGSRDGKFVYNTSQPLYFLYLLSTSICLVVHLTSVGLTAMYRRSSEPDVDSLRVELRRKEHDLVMAARFGKNLLEENTQVKNQMHLLREEQAKLQEVRLLLLSE